MAEEPLGPAAPAPPPSPASTARTACLRAPSRSSIGAGSETPTRRPPTGRRLRSTTSASAATQTRPASSRACNTFRAATGRSARTRSAAAATANRVPRHSITVTGGSGSPFHSSAEIGSTRSSCPASRSRTTLVRRRSVLRPTSRDRSRERTSSGTAALTACRCVDVAGPVRPTTRNPSSSSAATNDCDHVSAPRAPWVTTLAAPGAERSRARSAPRTDRCRTASGGDAASTAPVRSSNRPQPPVDRTTSSSTAAVPPLPVAAAVSARWAVSTNSLSATSWRAIACATARVIATKGVGRGISSTGRSRRSAAARSAAGTDAWLSPIPKPNAATPAVARRPT